MVIFSSAKTKETSQGNLLAVPLIIYYTKSNKETKMNYNRIYSELIIRAKRRTILKGNYKERHHIIPKSMGGTNEKWNLVDLFPEEHLIAHLLLVKIYPNETKIVQAAFAMTNGLNSSKDRIKNNKEYKYLAEKFRKLQSKKVKEYYKTNPEARKRISKQQSGINNNNYGRPRSQDFLDKISDVWTKEKRKEHSIKMKNRPKKPYVYKPAWNKGLVGAQKHSEETRKKISENNKGKNIGNKNGSSKHIIIYNSNDEIVYDCNGTFTNICVEYKLPGRQLKDSHANGGSKIFQNLSSRTETRLKNNGNIKFVGWYAKEVI